VQHFYKRERIVVPLILALLLAGLASTHRAYAAATIYVTTFTDNLVDNGDCSLREAIQAANTHLAVDACRAGSGADTIQLSAGTYTLTIPILTGGNDNATGDLNLTGDLTIIGVDGNTVWIDGGQVDRIFHIQPAANVRLRGFELIHGASAADGGGIYNDHGKLTLEGVNLAHNTASGNGGGIYNDHGVLIISGGIRDNTAGGNGGGIDNNGGTLTLNGAQFNNNIADGSGGAISNNAAMTLDRVWIHDNTARGANGGGIYNLGTARIANSFIHNSHTSQHGGNIYSGENGLGSLTISSTTISRGSAAANGGGVFNAGMLVLENITITENSAANGGGLYNVGSMQPLNLTNTTIVSNTNSPNSAGAGIFNIGAGLTLTNTLVAYNGTLGNCAGSAPIHSAGHNLASDSTCSFTATGDLTDMNPLLGPLEDKGGVTFAYGGAAPSYALLPSSPAINAGTNAGCPAVDQRGMARPHGALCDIGAFESNDAPRAFADSYTINEDTPLVVSAPGLLANDSDADNDVITAMLLMTPAHGVLTLHQDGAFSYIPTANYHGQDSFSYQISDGSLSSASTPVTLTVISVNDPPFAASDTASTPMDTILIIPVAVLLRNDTDIDADPLVISAVRGNSAHGGRVMLTDNSVVYTPPTHFSGVDSLIYTVSDGNGGTASGTVTVTVGVRLIYLPLARR